VKLTTALKEAFKYHIVAVAPTLVGGAIVVISLWVGVIDPALAAVPSAAGGIQGLLDGLLAAQYNVPVAVGGVVGGTVIRRIGKTALLFKIHGAAVVDVVDDELTEPDSDSARPIDGDRNDSADSSGETDEENGGDAGETDADPAADDTDSAAEDADPATEDADPATDDADPATDDADTTTPVDTDSGDAEAGSGDATAGQSEGEDENATAGGRSDEAGETPPSDR